MAQWGKTNSRPMERAAHGSSRERRPGPRRHPRANHDGRGPVTPRPDAAITPDLAEGDDQPEPAAERRCRAEFAVEPAEEAVAGRDPPVVQVIAMTDSGPAPNRRSHRPRRLDTIRARLRTLRCSP